MTDDKLCIVLHGNGNDEDDLGLKLVADQARLVKASRRIDLHFMEFNQVFPFAGKLKTYVSTHRAFGSYAVEPS